MLKGSTKYVLILPLEFEFSRIIGLTGKGICFSILELVPTCPLKVLSNQSKLRLTERSKVFVLTRAFGILSLRLSLWRLRLYFLTNRHEIWNCRTWYKGRAIYFKGFFCFISHPFENVYSFCDSYSQLRSNAFANCDEVWNLNIW